MVLDQECRLTVGKKYFLIDVKGKEAICINSLETLKKKIEFLTVRYQGKSTKSKFFILNYSFDSKINIKFGLTVSKKIGGAVTRNHVKRIIRTIVRNNLTSIPKGIKF